MKQGGSQNADQLISEKKKQNNLRFNTMINRCIGGFFD